jgi:L-serine kinase (ATP) / ParB family transcriptional regulator, heme-responsive regulator
VDLSVDRRPIRTSRSSPVLRVVETARLVLHEEPDFARVARMKEALRRDGVLRNPPVVAPHGADEHLLVLDGANRVTALRELGAPHLVAQVVNYSSPAVALSTWRHYVIEDGRPPVRDRLNDRGALRTAPVGDAVEAEERLRGGAALAAVVDACGAVLVAPGADRVGGVAMLRDLVALYRGAARIYRVDGGTLETLNAEYGAGTLIVFPPYGKDDIVRMAACGERLPAGITRHLIPARVLHLNAPLALLLEDREDAASKQRQLDAAVALRWQDHRVRYYAEPTYLFDE